MMKPEFSDLLIPTTVVKAKSSKRNYNFLNGFLAATFIMAFGLTVLRYEYKLIDLETRLEVLEVKDIQAEVQEENLHMTQAPLTRNRRDTSFHTGIPAWVKRSGAGDPILNEEHFDYLRTQSQRPGQKDDQTHTEEDVLGSGSVSGSSRTTSRSSQRSIDRRGKNRNIVRNHADETFFTQGQDGSQFKPSGLQEMYERLPPVSSEVAYESSQLETRAGASESLNSGLPPVQRVGSGRDQVSARVVRYEDSDSEHSGHNGGKSWKNKKSVVAAHYVADVSNFTSNENPRLRNSNGIFQIWRAAEWMNGENFKLDQSSGAVTIQKEGIYYIYSQIHYHDEQENSFFVEINDIPLLQCTTTQLSNTCFTAGMTLLKVNDKIVIKNLGVDRFSIYKPEKSFFGMVKLGEAY